MNMRGRFRGLIATLFAAHKRVFAEPEEPLTRRLKREEIQERERQAALRELEQLKNRRDFPS